MNIIASRKYMPVMAAIGLTTFNARGGDPAPPMEMAPPPVEMTEPGGEGLFADIGLSLAASVGYDSEYIWRGADLGNDLTWFDVSLGYEFSENVSFSVGAWQASWRQGDELDLYAGLSCMVGPVELSAGWIYYYFYEGGSDYHEYSLGAATSLGPVDLGLTWYIAPASGLDYNYVEFSVGGSIPISEYVSLDLEGAAGYGDDDFVGFQGAVADGGMTHIGAKATLAITIYKNVTLSPYIGVQVPFDELEDAYGDELYGGISLGVEF